MEEARKVTKAALDKCIAKGATDWSALKLAMRNALSDFMFAKTKRSPMILPLLWRFKSDAKRPRQMPWPFFVPIINYVLFT